MTRPARSSSAAAGQVHQGADLHHSASPEPFDAADAAFRLLCAGPQPLAVPASKIATGEKVPKRGVEARDRLTAQEEQIARLARDGRTSPEIGAQLFLSARTVEWHLGNVFTKLGIGSRRELHAALAQGEQDGRAAQPKVSTTGGLPGRFLRPPLYPGAAANTTAAGCYPLRGGFARAGGVAGPDVLDGLLRCSGRNAGGRSDQALQG